VKGLEADPSEVVSMPTQASLGATPTACGASDAPRVVAPFLTGTRHPVTITIDGTPELLATTSAVLRGDAKSACVVAYEARAVGSKKTGKDDVGYGALIPWGDLERAFVFKANAAGETWVRTMRCAASKDVPSGVSGVEGFGAASN
jgi:hypothetical protein